MVRGGMGVGGGFSFTFWLAHFNVLAVFSPFSLNALHQQKCLHGPGLTRRRLLPLNHVVHLLAPWSRAVPLDYR